MNVLATVTAFAAAATDAYAGFAAHPDAVLIALGLRHELLAAEVQRIDAFVTPIAAAIDSDLRARRDELPGNEMMKEMCRQWDEAGITGPHDRASELVDLSDPLSREIMNADARTVIGVAVKARCAAFPQMALWSEPFADLDWEKKLTRSLIESACRAAGFPPPDEPMTRQQYIRVVGNRRSAIAA